MNSVCIKSELWVGIPFKSFKIEKVGISDVEFSLEWYSEDCKRYFSDRFRIDKSIFDLKNCSRFILSRFLKSEEEENQFPVDDEENIPYQNILAQIFQIQAEAISSSCDDSFFHMEYQLSRKSLVGEIDDLLLKRHQTALVNENLGFGYTKALSDLIDGGWSD